MCQLTLTPVFFHLATNHRPSRMYRNSFFIATVLVLAFSATHAEVVVWHQCPQTNSENGAPAVSSCSIHEVRVEPCREALDGKPCGLKRGRTASISFDYTVNFSGDTLSSRVYWASEIMDLPFLGMPLDACTSTVCPATPGQRQTYSVELPMSKKFPARTYDLKWKLWNAQEQECCFMFAIKLLK
ncbi:PREDICTED: MD-2-related lipid-recognition protein-like [Dinoponera quadriceps]|uniref:MD-2-related lipid-recognition protein-like n=1 Tax=Dinoponera quadriceps TaxID=609295 RepID=A0A6P3X0K9_DINQU|nr:PREDICTED: MD-2-related lipid-recognition protein-like [Dinoponera quadriceps]